MGATFIVEVTGVSYSEIVPALKLRLSGPGIEGDCVIWVSGWRREWVEILKEKNSEYPLGVDTILSFKSHTGEAKICCLPRSTKIEIL
jgi:alpha-D-ribose 1-methylphosphonate 5-triphosphate synthase subunit PhnH